MHLSRTALMTQQLDEALAESAPDSLEIAVLAGLLARERDSEPLPVLARSCRETLSAGQLADAAEAMLDGFLEVSEDDDAAESWDALCALDEVCAAAAWMGHGDALRDLLAPALGVLRAFPEPWLVHAEAARAVLGRCPPSASDPALDLWLHIAATPRAALELSQACEQG